MPRLPVRTARIGPSRGFAFVELVEGAEVEATRFPDLALLGNRLLTVNDSVVILTYQIHLPSW